MRLTPVLIEKKMKQTNKTDPSSMVNNPPLATNPSNTATNVNAQGTTANGVPSTNPSHSRGPPHLSTLPALPPEFSQGAFGDDEFTSMHGFHPV